MTPLQMADMYATFANGGTVHTPHLLRGTPVSGYSADLKPEYLQLVYQGLRKVTSKGGTGYRGSEYGVQIAGKTGTVQNPHGKDHAVFAAFGPLPSPRYSVLCFIEEGESGGRVAAPLAAQLLAYLAEQNKESEKNKNTRRAP